MMEETLLVNRIKEKTCYVSMDFNRELRTPKGRNNPLRMEYVLPDYRTSTYGYVKGVDPEPENRSGDEQILPLTNERITIPELLFHPSDIGIPQAGIPEAIIQSVQSTPESIHGLLYSNIVLIGGNTRFPNFKMRLEQELRPLVPDCFDMNIYHPESPVTYAWEGANQLSSQGLLKEVAVTRAQYEEQGHRVLTQKLVN
eukprot:TRINITY_DN4360_c0_g1_i9.p1 TRINITY_DN4360_c0_g1~~TRINITY_DN4360_c0_g1_i9.p1  ORF type:complete len:199 (+),score=23.44 TRINITY_DN4360_c0_g1_i9:95-691(+)